MSLVNTRLQNLRVDAPQLSRYTLLQGRYGALAAFLAGNNSPMSIISPQLRQQALSAVGQTVQVPVFDSESVSIGSTRSATIADSENTSQLYTVSFTTYAWGFTIVPAQHMNNHISMQQDFNRKFSKYMIKFMDTLDAACVSALSTAKNQVFPDLLGLYANVGNMINVPLANRNEIFGDLNPIMKTNNHFGPYEVIGNAGVESLLGKLAEHGIYNDQNRTIQYIDKDLRFTTNITNAANMDGTGYCVQQGALGMVFRHEREAVLMSQTPDGHMWGQTNVPGTEIPLSSYFYYGVGDYSAIAGAATADMTRAVKEHYGFSIDVATITPYNTDLTTYANPIVGFQLADS